jgi:DNA-binding response OmpR family regulator
MDAKPRLLIVEDEESILDGLINLFVYHGFEVDAARDGEEGLRQALSGKHHLLILDVMLPGRDGFSICNAVREQNRELPIIMLTVCSSDEDIITGLRLGADDYITKPFSVHELVLRVQAVLRRSRGIDDLNREIIIGGRLRIDCRRLLGTQLHPTSGDPPAIEFTRREAAILQYLHSHVDRAVPRGELLTEVWGYKRSAQIETRTVDIHIAKLRRKIELDPKNPRHLVTVRGEGYRLILSETPSDSRTD